jgi:hypothetical protein
MIAGGGATVKETAMRAMWMAAALAAALPMAAPAAAPEPGRAGSPAGPTILGQGRTIVKIRLDRRSAPPGAHPMLVIEGLAYDTPPGVLYEVSLQAADGRRAPLGTINFYNRTAPGYGGAGGGGSSQSFDASEALRRLGGTASALVFEPSAGVTGVAAHANSAARLRFDSVSIRWR